MSALKLFANAFNHRRHTEENTSKTIDASPVSSYVTYETTILDLNDYCLIPIFDLLPLIDLCAIMETCARFQAIVQSMFTLPRRSEILKTWIRQNCGPHTTNQLRRILMHFGCMLKEIRLNGKQFYGPIVQEFLFRMNPSFDQIIFREVLGIIHHYCSSHLESLQLQNICIDAATGEKMRPLLRSLKKLQLYACEQANRACLFSEGSELVELDLEMTHSFDLKSYNFSKLESLSVSECKDNIGEWIDFITRHKNLKRLNFDINRYPEGIPAVLSLNHLQNFRLIISPEYMEHIDRLKELEHLEDFEIRCNGQNIAFVLNNVSFVDALNVLKCIDSKVDDQSIKEIVKFKNFKQLHIVNMKGLSKQYLLDIGDTLPQLELLHFTGFCDITSTGLAKIVKSLDKLKKLNLVATGYNLNQTTYQELVQIRRNKVQIFKLTIVIIEKICDGITRRWLDDWSRDYVEVFF